MGETTGHKDKDHYGGGSEEGGNLSDETHGWKDFSVPKPVYEPYPCRTTGGIKAADVAFHQTGAFCKMLTARWCAFRLGNKYSRTKVMQYIRHSNLSGDYKHLNRHKPRYDDERPARVFSDEYTVKAHEDDNVRFQLKIVCHIYCKDHDFNLKELCDAFDQMYRAPGGYTISFKYLYLDDHRHISGHSLGFIVDVPQTASKGYHASYECFDPLCGQWGFPTFDKLKTFVTGDWLPRFMNGSFDMDTSQPTENAKLWDSF